MTNDHQWSVGGVCLKCGRLIEEVFSEEGCDPPPSTQMMGWQSMETAPLDGKHCILAIKTGPFVYAIQGAYMNRKWMNAADIDAEPLAWMPNVRIPDEFLPWTDAYKARAALATTEGQPDA